MPSRGPETEISGCRVEVDGNHPLPTGLLDLRVEIAARILSRVFREALEEREETPAEELVTVQDTRMGVT